MKKFIMREDSLRKLTQLMKEDFSNGNMDDYWDLLNDPDLEDKEPTPFEQNVVQLAKQCNLYENISADSSEATLEGERGYLTISLINDNAEKGSMSVSGVRIDFESEDPAVWEQIRKQVNTVYDYCTRFL